MFDYDIWIRHHTIYPKFNFFAKSSCIHLHACNVQEACKHNAQPETRWQLQIFGTLFVLCRPLSKLTSHQEVLPWKFVSAHVCRWLSHFLTLWRCLVCHCDQYFPCFGAATKLYTTCIKPTIGMSETLIHPVLLDYNLEITRASSL